MASGGVARGRLAEERKSWRKSHPHGFVAKPATLPDGSVNLMLWNCVVPGNQGTDWEGGYFPLTLHFSEDYPSSPPVCKFPADFFHVNVYNGGTVCLSILGDGWKPSITVRQILIGIQDLLDNPNPDSPAQSSCYKLFIEVFLDIFPVQSTVIYRISRSTGIKFVSKPSGILHMRRPSARYWHLRPNQSVTGNCSRLCLLFTAAVCLLELLKCT